MPRWFRYLVYPAWFWLVFSLTLYVTFPVHMLRDFVVDEAEKALGRDHPVKVGRYGVNPEVRIGKMELHRLTGVRVNNFRLQFASANPDPGPELLFDQLDLRVSLFSLLGSTKTLHFAGEIWDGTMEGTITVDEKGEPRAIRTQVDGVRFDRSPLILAKAGVPVTGKATLHIDLVLGENPREEAKGNIEINTTGITVGPGEFKVPLLTGGFTIPLIDLGALTGSIPVENGRGRSRDLKLDGRDVDAEMEVTLEFGDRAALTTLAGGGSFALSEPFLTENTKFKSILEFPGPLQKAKDDDGRFHFVTTGTLQKPNFSLSRDGGKDRSASPRRRPGGRR